MPDSPRHNASEIPAEKQIVFLVGFMGVGKTSVGHALSEKLGWPFDDLDDRIEAGCGRSIEQIFQESGEAEFRSLELIALKGLLAETTSGRRIVALGGGAFAQAEVARLIAETPGVTVFLDAEVTELYRRCGEQKKERPLRRDLSQFRKLYEDRISSYQLAQLHIDTNGKDIMTVATEVACSLRAGTLK